jgi:hypothetical protein
MPRRPRNLTRALVAPHTGLPIPGKVQASELSEQRARHVVVVASSFDLRDEARLRVLHAITSDSCRPLLSVCAPSHTAQTRLIVASQFSVDCILAWRRDPEIGLSAIKAIPIPMVHQWKATGWQAKDYPMKIDMPRSGIDSIRSLVGIPLPSAEYSKIIFVNECNFPICQGEFSKWYRCHAAPPCRCLPIPRTPPMRRGGTPFIITFPRGGRHYKSA